MSTFSLKARWIVPVDSPPIGCGIVKIRDGRIDSISNGAKQDGPVQDLGDVVLLPGLVNAHTHLEFSQLDQPLGQPGISLPEWIRLIITNRQQVSRKVRDTVITGCQESLREGVTTVGDIVTENVSIDCGEVLPHLTAFQEVIGFSRARSDSVLEEVKQRLGEGEQRNRWPRDGCSPVVRGISPHAPYTVHPYLVERLVGLANEQQIAMAMHVAESREELELLANSTGPFQQLLEERSMWDGEAIAPGTRPMDYLEKLAGAPRSLVIHGNYLSVEEIRFLALHREKMSAVYCPRTHAFFAHSTYPLNQMLEAGVRVALGTDSRASNPDLSVLSEMHFVAAQHQEVAPAKILEMGTLAGAEALGLAAMRGSITPGKWADLTSVPCDRPEQDPCEALLQSRQGPRQTWVRGQLSEVADSRVPDTF